MNMMELNVHDVMWCAAHGHPVLTMHLSGTDRYFAVSVGPEDAASLAPHASHLPPSSRVRLYGLLESSIAALGARLSEVQLFVGDDAHLRAAVRITGPQGELTLPAHFADGIALAHRRRVPLRMTDEDLARVPTSRPMSARNERGGDRLAPYRDVIEALDLDDFN
jgi:bifunctional DNase/RNase